MQKIYKYEVYTQPTVQQTINIPFGAEVLSVGMQQGVIQLWVWVNILAPEKARNFVIFGTGHTIPDTLNLRFIGTVQLDEGSFIYHVFEVL